MGLKQFLACTAIAAVGLVIIYSIAHSTDRSTTPERKAAVASSQTATPSGCPIKVIHTGMLLEDVRSKLPGLTMDYRGSRQDESVYYVDAGVCHAFLDFNDGDHRLDSVDYGEGFDKIEFRKHSQLSDDRAGSSTTTSPPTSVDENVTPTPASSAPSDGRPTVASSGKTADAKGYPVPEDVFVDAYVLANKNQDDLDDDQLTEIARHEYRMAKDIDTTVLLLGNSFLDPRADRTVNLLEKLSKTSKPSH